MEGIRRDPLVALRGRPRRGSHASHDWHNSMKRLLAVAAALSVAGAAATPAAVLCRKKSGAVFARATCKKKETALNLEEFGAVGPKGDTGAPGTPGAHGTPGAPGMRGAPGVGPLTTCPPDSVLVGTTCVDTYEASVWQIPPSNTALVAKVQAGTATFADLTGGGATQLAPAATCGGSSDYGITFPDTGNWTPVLGSNPPSPGVYAVSIPGVQPSGCITWFQANEACGLSGKRLVRNDEWQWAAAGTPDPGTDNGSTDCNVGKTFAPSNTGSRSSCKSAWGVFDMVGNVEEWVADWADLATTCTDWTTSASIPGSDFSCFGGPGGAGVSSLPGALFRGGDFDVGGGTRAGVFAVDAEKVPLFSAPSFGFRCAR
jgi:hypothetical protein